MFNLARKIRAARQDETGASELVTTLFMLPLALFLILTLIDVSMYFNARSAVQNVTREGARQAAMWGGTGNHEKVRLNPGNTSTAQNISATLYDPVTGKCKQAGCTQPPEVKCDTYVNGAARTSAQKAGDRIVCRTTFHYKTVTPGSDYFGFSAAIGNTIVIEETTLSETGYRAP